MNTATSPGHAGAAGFHISDASRRLRFLTRRWPIVVLAVLASTVTAVGFSLTQEKEYTAEAMLLFRDAGLDQTLFGSGYRDPAREAATNVRLVGLVGVSQRTADALRAPGQASDVRRELGDRRALTERDISADVMVAPEGQSNLVSVSFTDPSPELAAIVANTFARQYVEFRQEADRQKIRDAQELVATKLKQLGPEGRNTREGRLLEQRAEQLEISSALQTGNAELVQPARVPDSPSAPNPRRSGILAALFGLLLGLGLAWLLDRLDRKIRDAEEAREVFDRPLLGSIPRGRLGRRQQGHALASQEAEAFMMFRASLRYFNVDRKLRSVLVTSATPGEGKTSVSFNLAMAAAATGSRVLLIEADLRRPTMASYFGLSAAPGLTNLLSTDLGIEDVAQTVPASVAFRAAAPDQTVDVIAAGPLPPNPADLLDSERMRQLVSRAEEVYDLVVIDTPPTSVVSDAVPLVRIVSGIIVVLRAAYSERGLTQRLRDQLDHLEAPVLGFVLNGVTVGDSAYYGYSAEYAVHVDREEFDEQLIAGRGARNGFPRADERTQGEPVRPA